jgi:small-conductance mechanosensitive channel
MKALDWHKQKLRSYNTPFHRFMYWTVLLIVVLFLLGIPLAIWTDRSLDYWFTYFKGVETNVPFIVSYILTICTNVFGVGFNLLTELLRLLL